MSCSITQRLQERASDERGALLAEYALIAVFLVAGLIGVVQFVEASASDRIEFSKCTYSQIELAEPGTAEWDDCN